MGRMENLLGGPEPTRLPDEPDRAARTALAEQGARAAAGAVPDASLPWAVLAERALADDAVVAYAYARTGYHRGLDALRRSGWKGQGPVPWSHEPNRGFLRALAALSQAAGEIEETEEEQRCRTFLADSSPEAAQQLLG